MKLKPDIVLDCDNVHAECPVWSEREQSLFWTDIESYQLWKYDPEKAKAETWDMREKLCAIAFRKNGGFLFAFASGLSFFDVPTGEEKRIQNIEENLPSTRLNDGRCDRHGRFIIGGFDKEAKGASGIYLVDANLHVRELFRGVSSANSICFSVDGRSMYFADTPRAEIWRFAYDPEKGSLGERSVFCRFDDQPGLPDGSVIDADGCLWNAQWNGSRVVRYTPKGQVDRIIEFPCENPTCIAFGGRQLDTLYITTSRLTLNPQQRQAQPHAGALFAVNPGVQGLPESTFGA